MDLIGNEQVVDKVLRAERREDAATVLGHGFGIVPHMGAQIQRFVRGLGNPAGALGKREPDRTVGTLHQRNRPVLHALDHSRPPFNRF